MLPSLGNLFKCHEEILSFQPIMIPPTKRFDVFPPDWGMLRRPDAFRLFLQTGAQPPNKLQLDEERHKI